MADLPIALKYAASETFSPGGGVTGVKSTVVSARVRNDAYAKDVSLAYMDSIGVWNQAPLGFSKTFGDHDIFQLTDSTIYMVRFALRYAVAGGVYWDNNGGGDYRVDESRPNTVGGNVALSKAVARRGSEAGGGFTFTTSWIEGEILVKNLSYNKRVGIRLSANGWATSFDSLATFGGNVATYQGSSQVEVWKFKTPELNLDTSAPDFAFAVFYQNLDGGDWYWDSDFAQNYQLSKADMASVE
jgi:hypothetical protein